MKGRALSRRDAALSRADRAHRFFENTISMQWVCSSTSLPRAGASIQFMLDHRKVPMDGTYTGGVFRSHWSTYDVGCVHSWCASDITPFVARLP